MKTREWIAWGAIAGMLVAQFSMMAITRGPSPDSPGEATVQVWGIVVDRVPIPADPDGLSKLPTDRIMRGLLAAMIGSSIVFGIGGGLIGWGIARSRRRLGAAKPAEQQNAGSDS